jgi:uncharacterized membrane protein YfcA
LSVLPELTAAQAIVLLALGLSVGTFGAMVGIGGGILIVPALLVLFPDAEPSVITSMSLTAVIFNALSATAGYRRRGWQDTRTGFVIAATAVPAAIAGAFLTRTMGRGDFEMVFGVALVLGAIYLAKRGRNLPSVTEPSQRGAPRHIVDTEGNTYDYRVRERVAASVALGSGLIAAFFGIGGGIINVPVMMLVLRMPAKMSVATSQLPLMFSSMAAVTVHLVITFGEWTPWLFGLVISVGTLTGAQIGVRLAGRASGRGVLLLIAAILLISGVRQILNSL